MANPSKKKGTRYESAVVKFMTAAGLDVARKPLSGNKDCGDLEVRGLRKDIIIEVKGGKQTSNPNRAQITEWLRQTAVEAGNAKAIGILVIVRYNRKIKDADVYIKWRGAFVHMWLDELCDWLSVYK